VIDALLYSLPARDCRLGGSRAHEHVEETSNFAGQPDRAVQHNEAQTHSIVIDAGLVMVVSRFHDKISWTIPNSVVTETTCKNKRILLPVMCVLRHQRARFELQ
jgi:hypothetical protein